MDNFMYLETNSFNPSYNLAFEEYCLNNITEGSILILWQNEPSIIIGQNQNTEEEINHTFVDKHHVHVVRRATGGGAVYHDLGNINYSFITDIDDGMDSINERFSKPIVEALKSLGLNASISGRNDILIDDKKVSGTAQRIVKKRILHHGTLLFCSDLSNVSKALKVDEKKYQSKSTKSVRSRVGNIQDFMVEKISLEEFWKRIKEYLLADKKGIMSLSKEDLENIRDLQNKKYATWEWNFGHSPKFNFSNKRKFPGGILEILADVQNGVIESIFFYGDFLSLQPLDDVRNAFKGIPFSPEKVEGVLEGFELQNYFGGIKKEEILEIIFG